MRDTFLKRWSCSLMVVAFVCTGIVPPSYAQSVLNLPKPGTMVPMSSKYDPALMVGIQLDVNDPFRLSFLINRGQKSQSEDEKAVVYKQLIKYFLASLTTPNEDMWVNLSPFEHERIIPDDFSLTEMGRDLLVQDYLLKQITSSLLYPDSDIGKKFWKKVYKLVFDEYGTTDIPLDTFNKVWIIPDKAVIYQKKDTAVAVESHLKVMLETDYLAMNKAAGERISGESGSGAKAADAVSSMPAEIAKNVIRDIVIPALEKEVNEGENFSQLRQIYSAMLMATWFKKTLKQSILSKVYMNKSKVAGVELDDPAAKERIYQQYLQAFKVGVFNFIKEEEDPLTQELIPRKYFSGGLLTFKEEGLTDASEAQGKDFSMKFNGLIDVVKTKFSKIVGSQKGSPANTAITPVTGDGQVQEGFV